MEESPGRPARQRDGVLVIRALVQSADTPGRHLFRISTGTTCDPEERVAVDPQDVRDIVDGWLESLGAVERPR